MTQPETHTLDAPGAVLTYDVRRNDASTQPVLLLVQTLAVLVYAPLLLLNQLLLTLL